jgi:hypothetical protein
MSDGEAGQCWVLFGLDAASGPVAELGGRLARAFGVFDEVCFIGGSKPLTGAILSIDSFCDRNKRVGEYFRDGQE